VSDPLSLLARSDKSILGAGEGIAYAPGDDPQTPGFWTGGVVLGRTVTPLFAVTLLDADGRELAPRVAGRRWTPSALVVEYRFAHGIQATEVRTVHPGGVFVSEWRLSAMASQFLHLIAWTAVHGASLHSGSMTFDGALNFTRDAGNGAVQCSLAVVGGATSWAAVASEGALETSTWRSTPFLEHWRNDGLPNETRAAPTARGRCFGAVHRSVRIGSDGASVAFAMRAIPGEPALRPPAAASGVSPASGTFEGASRRRWETHFAELPQLSCSDPYLERVYWYRWFGARILRIDRRTGAFHSGGTSAHSASIGTADATLAPATVRDLRWHPDPAWRRGALFQFFDHQRLDGSLPKTVGISGPSKTNAPPTVDWGGALRAFVETEDDLAHVESAWRTLERYARWLFASHDTQGTGLVDLLHPDETSRASSPRFAVRRLKGVDSSAMGFALCRALADVASRIGERGDEWSERAARTASAVRARMWDEELGLFCDIDAASGERIRIRSAAGFTPFAAGLAWPEAIARMAETLLDVRHFWTPFPVPSLSASEPGFDAFGEASGIRVERPQNGRMWPGETAMLVDALVASEPDGDGPFRRAAAQLLRRLVRVHFHDGDLRAASAHEHANPYTGHPSVYRGVDEFYTAWLVDLVARHAAGIHPTANGIRLDPLPMGLEALSLDGLSLRGRMVGVVIGHERVRATIDGVEHETRIGAPLDLVF
jgi:hypothetical protein